MFHVKHPPPVGGAISWLNNGGRFDGSTCQWRRLVIKSPQGCYSLLSDRDGPDCLTWQPSGSLYYPLHL